MCIDKASVLAPASATRRLFGCTWSPDSDITGSKSSHCNTCSRFTKRSLRRGFRPRPSSAFTTCCTRPWRRLLAGISSHATPVTCLAPRRKRFEIRPLSMPQFQQFLAVARGHQQEALFILALASGVRRAPHHGQPCKKSRCGGSTVGEVSYLAPTSSAGQGRPARAPSREVESGLQGPAAYLSRHHGSNPHRNGEGESCTTVSLHFETMPDLWCQSLLYSHRN